MSPTGFAASGGSGKATGGAGERVVGMALAERALVLSRSRGFQLLEGAALALLVEAGS